MHLFLFWPVKESGVYILHWKIDLINELDGFGSIAGVRIVKIRIVSFNCIFMDAYHIYAPHEYIYNWSHDKSDLRVFTLRATAALRSPSDLSHKYEQVWIIQLASATSKTKDLIGFYLFSSSNLLGNELSVRCQGPVKSRLNTFTARCTWNLVGWFMIT